MQRYAKVAMSLAPGGDVGGVAAVTTTGTQTLTNKTLTAPSVNTPTIAGGTQGGTTSTDVKVQSAQFDAVTGTTGTTLTNLTGLSHTLVAGATYKFRIQLPGVATANSGLKVGFKYTTLTLTSLEASAEGKAAASVVNQHTTTATDQATLLGSTTAIINAVIEGTLVVNAGGTLQVQAAQNAAHADTTSVYAGASSQFTRTA